MIMGSLVNLKVIDCKGVLEDNYIGRIAYIADNVPHVVPSTYFFDRYKERILCFATNGHRINALRMYNKVSFQVDHIESFKNWKSVQVHGIFEELTGNEAKDSLKRFVDGVQGTIEKKNAERPSFLSHFSTKLQEAEMPVVYSIVLNEITGKSITDNS